MGFIKKRKNKRTSSTIQAREWQSGLITPLNQKMPQQYVTATWKFVVVSIFLAVLALGGVTRLMYLQVIQGRYYRVLSDSNRIVVRNLPYERGILYDRNGLVLAQNQPTFQLALVFSQIPQSDGVINAEWESTFLSIFDIEKEQLVGVLEQAQKQPFIETPVKSGYSHEQYLAFESNRDQLAGVYMRSNFIRDYIDSTTFSHIIGYTGEITKDELEQLDYSDYLIGEQVGRVGIEETFQSLLRGVSGKEVFETNSRGESIRTVSKLLPVPGSSVYLTVDGNLQKHIYDAIQSAIEKYNAIAGVGIIQNIKTGEILSLVSIPTYDNNLFAKGISSQEYTSLLNDPKMPLFNRAVAGTYPPGSTVKPFVGLAALDEGIISATTLISDIPQVIEIGGGRFPDWRVSWGRGPVGNMTVKDAIAESSNIFFYKISGGYEDIEGIGIDRIKKHLQRFNIASLTGIDLNAEVPGVFPDRAWKLATKNEQWYLGDDYQVGIGQGDLLVTPLQMVNAVTALANSGRLLRPQLVDKVIDSKGNTIEDYMPDVIRELPYSQTDFATIRAGMRQAVEKGIVYPLRNAIVPIAAKTGTAEYGKQDEKGIYETHAWVEGFAPYDDPEISFVVMLEKGGSSSNAAEVAKDIVNWYFGQK